MRAVNGATISRNQILEVKLRASFNANSTHSGTAQIAKGIMRTCDRALAGDDAARSDVAEIHGIQFADTIVTLEACS